MIIKLVILNTYSCNVSEDGGFSYLSLDGVTDDDIGEYEAVASNDLGQVVSRSVLTLKHLIECVCALL